ncbi:MAG TPA: virulence factor [Prolixibacteraceae bacterium]|jgi:type IV secretory pathway VirJ component|nr:virulence factor [Prolixibacteraceae bacterium]
MKALIFLILVLSIFNPSAHALSVDTLRYGNFGKIVIYKPGNDPNSVVLFVSGDGGWNMGVVEMSQRLVQQGALVAGINIKLYFKSLYRTTSTCYYPAADFEDLSLMLQKRYRLDTYHKPILVGYSSGATLVYGILVQAPAATFQGAISLGFCPDIEINKPLCAGSGLKQHVLKEGKSFYLEPSEKLTAPFIALNGTKDLVCDFPSTQQFLKEVNTGVLIELPMVGHGFAVLSNWIPQFKEAYHQVLLAPSFAEQKNAQNTLLQSQNLDPLPIDLPIVLVPTSQTDDSKPMVFLVSGDGGWTNFDHSIAESLAEKGMPVVGLDAQKYFWNGKTPEVTALEVEKAVVHYLQQWKRKKFILVGYSFGANVVPFIADKFSEELKDLLSGIYCLSPNLKADFEIHLMDMLGWGGKRESYNVPEQIKKNEQFKTYCIFGDEEEEALRARFQEAGAQILIVPGNHHYNNNPSAAGEAIYKQVEHSDD